MSQIPEELTARLAAATHAGARANLVRRGLARGMIWRNGIVPEGAPPFSAVLTEDLLDHGYGVLVQSLELRDIGGEASYVERGLRVAAESIESAVRHGGPDQDRDFNLVVAACAFHLAHYGARAFCLVPSIEGRPNLATPELALVGLMRRSLRQLRAMCADWLRAETNRDDGIAARLRATEAPEALDEVEAIAITSHFLRSLGTFLTALESGDAARADRATSGFASGAIAAAECRHVPLWWANTLARHLSDDLWASSMSQRIPALIEGDAGARWSLLRDRYVTVLRARETAEVDLWPSQWEASRRCVDPTDDLVVSLPTSAGKTRVAELCILRALADQKRIVYVTPLRALSAQLERTLSRTFRPLGVTVTALYGASGVAAADVATLRDADIVVATPEKLDFALRVDPSVIDDVGLLVLDEGHMIGIGDREVRYEVLVQRLLRRPDAEERRIVCLSAVFGPGQDPDADHRPEEEAPNAREIAFRDFTAWIRSDVPGTAVVSRWRPTRQRSGVIRWGHAGGRLELTVDEETPFVPNFVREEPAQGKRKNTFPQNPNEFVLAAAKAFMADNHRVLVYCPQRRSVEALGKTLIVLEKQGYLSAMLPAGADISRALRIGREWLGANHIAVRALERGVALHHAGLPRAYLSEVEDLLQRRVLRMVIASPTLAQGIDLSCSVLIFRSIYRIGDELIPPEEFANVVGRAGRAYVDLDGITVLPVFESGYAGRKLARRYRRLVEASASRRLESGLVLLVEQLTELLARGLGVDVVGLREYVLNVASEWNVEVYETAEGNEVDADLVAPALAKLDAALLSTVEDLDCSSDFLGDALDSALRASLWVRRLAQRDGAVAQTSRDILVGRARWIWSRTAPASRYGYHAAGIGYATGRFLDEHEELLISLLLAAEDGLASGQVDDAVGAIVEMAGLFATVPPFAFQSAAEGWEHVLRQWILGEPLGGFSSSDDRGAAVDFIQGDVVFRLVWAVEAARVHGAQTGVQGADQLTGQSAAVLTYGEPTPAGIMLAKAGLSSRAMIARLLTAFPAAFSSAEELESWILAHGEQAAAPGFWTNAVEESIWRDFALRWTGGGPGPWRNRRESRGVRWDRGADIPSENSLVLLVQNKAPRVTYVCASDLSPLGQLTTPLEFRSGSVVAHVGRQRNRVIVDLFGP